MQEIKQYCISHDTVLLNLKPGKYVVMQAMYLIPEDEDADSLVRLQVQFNEGVVTTLWLEMPLGMYEMLPAEEIPGEDADFDEMTLT